MTTFRRSKGSVKPARKEGLPPFFAGELSLGIIMALAEFGPLRLGEIEKITGRTEHSKNTRTACNLLQSQGVVFCTVRSRVNVVVELDRRHPAAGQIRGFGQVLYRHYLEPTIGKHTGTRRPTYDKTRPHDTTIRRRPSVPATPKHDPARLDLHVLGSNLRMRILHLLAERGWGWHSSEIRRYLEASMAAHGTILELERYGIVETKMQGTEKFVKLNRQWFAAPSLKKLLDTLNAHMPKYAAMAKIYRENSRAGKHGHAYRKKITRDRNRDSRRF